MSPVAVILLYIIRSISPVHYDKSRFFLIEVELIWNYFIGLQLTNYLLIANLFFCDAGS